MSHRLRRCEPLTRFATKVRIDHEPSQHRDTRWRWFAPGLSVESVRIDDPVPYQFEIQSPYPFILLLDAVRQDGETSLDTLPTSHETDGRDKLILAPGDCTMKGWSTTIGRPIRIVTAYFDPMSPPIAEFFRSRETAFRPILHFQNEALRDTLNKMRYAAENSEFQSRTYGEHLASLLMMELLQVNNTGLLPIKSVTGGLAPKAASLVRDSIEARLREDVSLGDLAALANLSPFHFTRAFKATFGLTPYQFILKRRIDRAKRLLIETDLPIAEIAKDCGFAGPTQFGRTFRIFSEQSPREWRRRRE
jgi:AraC family transcriptional regulator